MKLSTTEIDLIKYIKRSRYVDDWAQVSEKLWPYIMKLPVQLIELKEAENNKFVKLSHDGEIVFYWLL